MSSTPYTVSPDVAASQPVVDADFTALNISAITSTSPYGFASKADADAVVQQLKDVVAALKALGIISAS